MLILSRVVIALGIAGAVVSAATTPLPNDEAILASEAKRQQPRTVRYSHRYVFMADMTAWEAQQLCESLGIAYIRQLPSTQYLCIDRNHGTSGETGNILEGLVDSPGVVSAKREKYIQMKLDALSFDDPKWNDMWHLQPAHTPSSNIYEVWEDGLTGQGIVVAIVDTGIQGDHADLVDNYRSELGYDAVNEDDDPSHDASDSGHGTNCAGIVAAGANNGECSIGVSYNAQIAAIKHLDEEVSATWSSTAAALTHQLASIDIYSNSWSYITDGESYTKMGEAMADALALGVTTGRNNRGAIYTFSAGNGERDNEDTNEQTHKTSIYTIVIGSVSPDGSPAYYTTPGATVLAATYGGDLSDNSIGIITPDRDGGCMTNFQGTSAACPVASGIIALALEANPDLTWRDVQHLIVTTSSFTGLSGDTFITNGAGLNVSDYFGFGLMNAAAMVDAAKTWENVGPLLTCGNEPTDVNSDIITGDFSHSVTVEDCTLAYIENVLVRIAVYTQVKGNMQIFLVSPHGTRSRLMRFRPADLLDGYYYWEYGSVQFWGENPNGQWTLDLENKYDTYNSLRYWNMTFYGKDYDGCQSNPCQNNAVCVNQDGSYMCQCETGYTGTHCEYYNECLDYPCENGGTCSDLTTGYTCNCRNGYYGTNCQDYNECLDYPCENGGTCSDLTTGYTCNCRNAYFGTNCQDYDGCQSNPCQNNAVCVNQDGSYMCQCETGYSGTHCEYYNECLDYPCENGGTCSDLTTGYTCNCRNGYYGTNCQDYNECLDYPCENGGTCSDLTTGYTCNCRNGYYGTNCQDYDGCQSNPCQNNAVCVNQNGYYVCQCDGGYTGTHCQYFNECLSGPCENGGTCTDKVNGYSCRCTSDYTGKNCQELSSGNNSVHLLSTVVILAGLVLNVVFNI